MTAVAFHVNVGNRRDYTCRLLRKAYRAGARVAVTGDGGLLAELDRLLWIFDPIEFVPHWRGATVAAMPPRLAPTPIVLVQQAGTQAGHTVLVNLGEALVPGFEAFERVIEVVGAQESERASARKRWREYGARGLSVELHEART